MNIIDIFYIDDNIIEKSVNKKINDIKHMYISKAYKNAFIKTHIMYSDVYIVQNNSGFVLVYGCYNGTGTGPFKTKEKAQEWFINGGR